VRTSAEPLNGNVRHLHAGGALEHQHQEMVVGADAVVPTVTLPGFARA